MKYKFHQKQEQLSAVQGRMQQIEGEHHAHELNLKIAEGYLSGSNEELHEMGRNMKGAAETALAQLDGAYKVLAEELSKLEGPKGAAKSA